MFLLQCCQHLTFSSVYNHQASFLCWAEAIFVGNVMPSTWGLLHNRTNQLSVAFSEHLSLRVFPVGMFLTTVALYLDVSFFCHANTFTVVVTYIFARSFLHVHCRCRGLLLCLITLNDTLTHTNTRTVRTTPLDEGSARRRDHYLYNTQYSQETNIHALGRIRTQSQQASRHRPTS